MKNDFMVGDIVRVTHVPATANKVLKNYMENDLLVEVCAVDSFSVTLSPHPQYSDGNAYSISKLYIELIPDKNKRVSVDTLQEKQRDAVIAAAPDMLEALKWACERIDVTYCPCGTYGSRAECQDCVIGKAIAKAEVRE